MEDKDLENIRLLMLDNLDLALQLIKGQDWDLKEVLLRLYNSSKICNTRKYILYSNPDDILSIHLYEDHSSAWYINKNEKCKDLLNAIDWIIQQLISDNRWNT